MQQKVRRLTRQRVSKVLAAALAGLFIGNTAVQADQGETTAPVNSAATLYYNGSILTMEGEAPRYVEAIVAKDGLIAFTGSVRAARRMFPAAHRINLQGQTLVPGFIDGHGHIYLIGLLLSMANVLPTPDGTARNYEDLVSITRAWVQSDTGKQFIKTFGWILANGYDHTMLAEGEHPTADVLDRISTDLPVLMLHQSGHLASLNHKGLELAGLNKDTPDPAGGVVRRGPDGAPNGVLEESAVTRVANMILSRVDGDIDTLAIARGQDLYIRYGYTTAEEARAYPSVSAALERAARANHLRIDVIGYPDIAANVQAMATPFWRTDRAYIQHYRTGGVKISLDGSPQSKTAWLTHPYHVPLPHTDADYRGYPAMPDARAQDYFNLAADRGWQIICHANGDAAIDQCLNAIETAQSRRPSGNSGPNDHRSVVIHAQTMRADQVLRTKALDALPSFFAAHTFYWGDYHRTSTLGSPRAERISPTRDALSAGLTLTTHHDSPVIMPNAMGIVDATVNRTTRSGFVLGPEQRLTAYEALKAVTIWGAIQHFEEGSKGTLAAGKRADFAVLSDNPLAIAPARIKTIRVTATIKDGRTIMCAPDTNRTAVCNARRHESGR